MFVIIFSLSVTVISLLLLTTSIWYFCATLTISKIVFQLSIQGKLFIRLFHCCDGFIKLNVKRSSLLFKFYTRFIKGKQHSKNH